MQNLLSGLRQFRKGFRDAFPTTLLVQISGPINSLLISKQQGLAQREQLVGSSRSPEAARLMRSVPPASAGGSSSQVGWKRLDYDVEGEWGFYLILDEFLKSPAESRRAAAGWGGDRFAVYEGPQGEVLFVSLSTWDTESDAREFFDAYVKRTGLRYPGATQLNSADPQTRNPEIETGNRKSFLTSPGSVTIELRGNRVAVIEGLPDRTDPASLLRALW